MFFKRKVVNIVFLSGVINSRGKKSLALSNIKPLLDKAYSKPSSTKAVALVINSPGGSASQSEIIANYIKCKSLETKIPTISFVEDMAASGGYFIAAATESIYALAKTSIVGSIGVLFSGFGFPEFIKKYGVERRIYTSGKNKVLLDPFKEEKEESVSIINQLLHETHEHFKDFVKQGRGNRLKINDEELFSGKFWLASSALKIGLIDDIVINYESFIKQKFGKKIKINVLKSKKGLFNNLFCAKIGIEDDLIDNMINSLTKNSTLSTLHMK